MKRLLFLTPLLFIGCTMTQRITYLTEDLSPPPGTQTIPIMVDVRVFEDNRANIVENQVLFNTPRNATLDGRYLCINSEVHYRKDPVVNQMARMLVEHFNKARLFRMSFYEKSQYSNYYLTGVLNRFYAEMDFSSAAAFGAHFGLLGALATSGVRSPGKVIIDISDLRLYRLDGSLVMEFGDFYKEYVGEFRADGYCWCAFWAANEVLKEFNTHLTEKIRSSLADFAWE